MIGLRYIDELFAIYRIPREFWRLIREDLRWEGKIRALEGIVIFLLLPSVVSSSVVYFQVAFDTQFYSLLIAAATLFVGFSMNSVLLLLKYSNQENSSSLLVNQTRNIISYLLYLGLLLAFLGISGYIFSLQIKGDSPVDLKMLYVNIAVSSIAVFVLVHFLIVVAFLPARIFTIIEQTSKSSFWD
ncbi:hypothetical protein ACOJIV_01050 [Haloarcula sp. AONF1]